MPFDRKLPFASSIYSLSVDKVDPSDVQANFQITDDRYFDLLSESLAYYRVYLFFVEIAHANRKFPCIGKGKFIGVVQSGGIAIKYPPKKNPDRRLNDS